MAIELINQKKEKIKFIRILIGNSETGSSKIEAPTKTITFKGISVKEAYEEILRALKNIK